jgi:hypothetical protein
MSLTAYRMRPLYCRDHVARFLAKRLTVMQEIPPGAFLRFDVAHLDHSAISNYGRERTTNRATRRATAAMDYLARFVLPLCSALSDRPDPHRPITSAVFLVDIASFSFKQAWNVRGYAQDISRLLATCYPETVDKVYVSAR